MKNALCYTIALCAAVLFSISIYCYVQIEIAGNPVPLIGGRGIGISYSDDMVPTLFNGDAYSVHAKDAYSNGDVVSYKENTELEKFREENHVRIYNCFCKFQDYTPYTLSCCQDHQESPWW